MQAEKTQAKTPARPVRRRGFWRDNRGAAVEFAFVATPFFALIFAIMETALVFFAGQVLETAVQDSARKILTGQAQGAGWSQNQFKQDVCNRVSALFDCQNGLQIDVRKFTSFQNVNVPNPVVNGKFQPDLVYDPGGPSDIVVVRLFYLWPVAVPSFNKDLSNVDGNKRLISATAAFRNEPFAAGGS